MEAGHIACPRCQARLPASAVSPEGWGRCGGCGQVFEAMVFPALSRAPERSRPGARLVDSSHAACFFHAGRQATVACDQCGRFLCELCDLPLDGRHTCPACLDASPAAGRRNGPRPGQQSTVLYDNIALLLAVLPVLCFYLTFLTAPAALFVAVRYWNRIGSPVPRSRFRFVAAGFLALVQMAAWIALGVSLGSGWLGAG